MPTFLLQKMKLQKFGNMQKLLELTLSFNVGIGVIILRN